MKVIDNTIYEATINDLEAGDVFLHNGKYYMLTECIGENPDNYINAVNLKTGELTYFCSVAEVYSLDDAQVVING